MPSGSKDSHTSRTWSLKRNKETLKLTSEQKKRNKMTSSVDPTRAITEEEPFQVNQTKSTNNIRAIQFKDRHGNPITEPDWSNPTRPRWERPLDTIRSFQDAIYKDSNRQSSYYVVDNSVDNTDNSWRHSYHHQAAGPYEPSFYQRNSGAQSNYGESDVGYGNMNVRSPPGTNPGSGGAAGSPLSSNGSSGAGSSNSYASRSNGIEGVMDPNSEISSFGYFNSPRDPDSPLSPHEVRPGQQRMDSNRPAAPFSSPNANGNSHPLQMSNLPTTEVSRKPIALNSSPSPPSTSPQKPEKRKSWFKRKASKG
ncbi:hypothetical protein RUND412_004961 [Rhizina undulata]